VPPWRGAKGYRTDKFMTQSDAFDLRDSSQTREYSVFFLPGICPDPGPEVQNPFAEPGQAPLP